VPVDGVAASGEALALPIDPLTELIDEVPAG